MRRYCLPIFWLFLLCMLVLSCAKEDYYYPSVKLEFVTVKADDNGKLQSLIPDKGGVLSVAEDLTHSILGPHSSRRVISNYEVVASNGERAAKVYSLQSVITYEPRKENDPAFQGGVKTDPVDMTSIWVGREYLNMILSLKVKGGKQHVFGIVEENIEEDVAERVVTLSLFHDANGDMEYYNRRAYISVPLTKYKVDGSDKIIRIKFKYHTYDENGQIIESDKYCNPGFVYVPDAD